jgi:hypothetical protein
MTNKRLENALTKAMEYWGLMQKSAGDEGAEFAEMFEQQYYVFINELRHWFLNLENKPSTLEEAEQLPEIVELFAQLPDPLHINLITDLEEIVDGIEPERFD